MTKTLLTTCSRCGATLSADAAGGLCPRCLMAMNFESLTIPEGDDSSHAPPLSPEEIAEKFPQFEILECLGRGGMGVVYKARQKSLNRLVAIKILPPERVGEARFSERFATEAATLAKLSHPNIVTVHDFGETGGLFYIVMEYVDGVNLRELLRDGKLAPDQALAVIPPICEALHYAHEKGIVHRDIKPENVLLDRSGRVKIADFGIASLIGATGEGSGTPPYMAPEQSDALREVDHRADIYALGVVLYEMLTGERPGKEVIAPSRKVQIDVRLDEIVLRALEKKPEMRFQEASVLKTQVELVANAGQVAGSSSVAKGGEIATASKPQGAFARFWWLFFVMIPLGGVLGSGVGLLAWNIMPKKYEATTILQITPTPGEMSSAGSLLSTINALESRKTLEEVVARLNLDKTWRTSKHEAPVLLRSLITAGSVDGTDLFSVSVRDTDPREAVEIVKILPEVLRSQFAEDSSKPRFVVCEEPSLAKLPVSPKLRQTLSAYGMAGLAASPLIALLLIPLLGRLASHDRRPPEVSQTELDVLSSDPAHWHFFLFYFCRQDPRIVVPKRTPGLGWTVNFANPWAIPFVLAAVAGVLGTLKLLRTAGLSSGKHQIIAVIALLGVISWICHRLSRGPVTLKGSPTPLTRTLITAILASGVAVLLWKIPGHQTTLKDTAHTIRSTDEPTAIDLTPFHTSKFDVVERFPGLLPQIDGLPFVTSGFLYLYGTQNAQRDHMLPMNASDIPIGRKFDELHVLHSAAWEEISGRTVAIIRLHYADGSHHDFEIQYNVHLMDWNRLPSEEKEVLTDEHSKLIWRGAGAFGGTGRLFKTMLRNPHPELEVKSMDVISTGTRVSYQLFAATTANRDSLRTLTTGMPLNRPAFAFEGALKVRVVDAATGQPIAGADVAPWGMIAGENIVVPPQLTAPSGETVVKYPVNRTEDFHMEVSKAGYRTETQSWREGNIPREQTFRLKPAEASPPSLRVSPGVPEVSSSGPEVIVGVMKDGRLQLDGQYLPAGKLLEKLKAISAKSPNQPVTLKAEPEGRYQDVINVLEMFQEARLPNITFDAGPATEPTAPSGNGK